jgi:hypothetical protein
MRHIKSITVTAASSTMRAAMAALVIFVGISFSGASQALIKHGVKGNHKHTLVKHGIKAKHQEASGQTLAKKGTENEQEAGVPDSAYQALWFANHAVMIDGVLKIPDNLEASWYHHDALFAPAFHEGSVTPATLGTSLDTVKSIGPFNQGGYTSALLVSAANDSIMFAGSNTGGLWKSTNAGSYWSPMNDTSVLQVSCITQSSFNSNNILYSAGGQVFKSTDGGNTFNPNQTLSFTYALSYSKASGSKVYAGTAAGLDSSADGGSTWGSVAGTTGTINSIVSLSPSGTSKPNPILISKQSDGLYLSPSGISNTFVKLISPAFPSGFSQVYLSQCKNFPNVVYAAFNVGSSETICRTINGGSIWTAVTSPGIATQGGYDLIVSACPFDSSKVLCGGVYLSGSTDGGTHWTGLSGTYHADDHSSASFNSSHYFLIGSDGGVVRHNWDSLLNFTFTILNNNYVTTQFYGGDFASARITCMGGTQDNATWRFRPSLTDQIPYLGGDASFDHVSQQDSNLAYGFSWGPTPTLQRSSNFMAGASWTAISPPLSGGEGYDLNGFYQCNYGDGYQLYLPSSKGVWRTIDSGRDWTRLNTSDMAGIQYLGCTNAANPSIYFSTHVTGSHDHFYRIDNAKTFSPGTPVDLSASMADTADAYGEITVYPTNPSTLFTCITTYANIPHIYKITNANTATPTWTNISGNMPPTLAVNQVQCDPSDSNSLLATTDYGLYYSRDLGAHWSKEYRIPNTSIREMQLRASDRKLFLFTYGRGVWYCSLGTAGMKPVTTFASSTPTPDELQFSMYPNPATEKLIVDPQQALSSSAQLSIYSIDGRMISESAWSPIGGDKQEVNIGSLPSGVYFLQIRDGNRIAKSKFIKM